MGESSVDINLRADNNAVSGSVELLGMGAMNAALWFRMMSFKKTVWF
jgi:hypothetical protein